MVQNRTKLETRSDDLALVRRMHLCERRPHTDSYDVTLDELRRAFAERPVSIALAVLTLWWEQGGQP
jgi:hypothetical protein